MYMMAAGTTLQRLQLLPCRMPVLFKPGVATAYGLADMLSSTTQPWHQIGTGCEGNQIR